MHHKHVQPALITTSNPLVVVCYQLHAQVHRVHRALLLSGVMLHCQKRFHQLHELKDALAGRSSSSLELIYTDTYRGSTHHGKGISSAV